MSLLVSHPRLLTLAALGSTLAAVAPTTALAAEWKSKTVALPASALERLIPPTDGGSSDRFFELSPRPGDQLIAWKRGTDDRRTSSILTLSAGGKLGKERRLPHVVAAVATDRSGRGLALTTGDELDTSSKHRQLPGVWATPIAKDGSPGKAQRLTSRSLWADPQLAVNARGDAVAVWLESPITLRAAVRPAGQKFGPSFTLARADANAAQLGDFGAAISETGRVLVAYGTNVQGSTDQALAWVGAVGRPFGPRLELGRMTVTSSEDELGAAISAGFDGRGRGYVAWGGPKRQSPVSYASIAPASARFAKAVTVDRGSRVRGTDWAYQGASLAPLSGGGALLAWASPGGSTRAASIGAAGQLVRTQRLPGTSSGTALSGPGGASALVAATSGGPELWQRRGGGLLRSVGPLPAVASPDEIPAYGFDAAGRFRSTTFGVNAAGAAELRISTLSR